LIAEKFRWNEDRKTRPQYQMPDGFFGGLAKTDMLCKKVASKARGGDQRDWYQWPMLLGSPMPQCIANTFWLRTMQFS
jgi:hypothetical protein